MKDQSIYELKHNDFIAEIISEMKIVMVKGVGYIVVSKKTKVTPELLLNIAESIETRKIDV